MDQPNLLTVEVNCPDISSRPLLCHVVDLDKAQDRGVRVDMTREQLQDLVGVATEWLNRA